MRLRRPRCQERGFQARETALREAIAVGLRFLMDEEMSRNGDARPIDRPHSNL